MKVFLVDDELTTRRVMKSCVMRLGGWSIEASSGRIAWEVFCDNEDIQLVICDFQMPELEGDELIRRIRNGTVNSKVPILATSGVIGPKGVSHLLELGADRFVPKPIPVDELCDCILRVTDQGGRLAAGRD